MVPTRFPAGFADIDDGHFRVIAPRLLLEEMAALLSGEERDRPAEGLGRGGTRRIVLAGGNAVYCRKYLRGGFARHFTYDLFLLRPERPIHELIVTETARAAGCPVPAVLACAVEDVGPFYRGWLVTEAIEPARPLIDALVTAAGADRARLLDAVREAVDSLHRIGVYHVDLTGHNVIIRDDLRPAILDFDRARLASPSVPARAARSFARLRRSLAKLAPASGVELSPEDLRRLAPAHTTKR
jgi:tRNA A-37 threonylcarbamoyl transferase component Bud32